MYHVQSERNAQALLARTHPALWTLAQPATTLKQRIAFARHRQEGQEAEPPQYAQQDQYALE